MHPKERGHKLLNALLEGKDGDVMKLLKDKIDFTVENKGDTPIHLAARSGKLEIIKQMKTAGADLRQRNVHGNTAMHYAAKGGFIDMVKYLKSEKVDMNACNDNEGESPLDKAVSCQTMNVIEVLVDLGMNPNVKNKHTGDTPLHTALRSGAQEAMEGLLIKGANPNITNNDGKRAEDVAKNRSIRESLKMYSTLLIAMSSGYIKAKGMKIAKRQVKKNMIIDRVGVMLVTFDIPKEFPTGFYCRREKAENATVVLKKFEDETVFSDVFHVRIFEVNRDCLSQINLPLYKAPTEKEQLMLRFFNCTLEDRQVDEHVIDNGIPYCPFEALLVPETNYVCAVYIRPKKEEKKISADEGAKITSEIEKAFTLDVPPGSFEEETVVSLQVFETHAEVDDDTIEELDETVSFKSSSSRLSSKQPTPTRSPSHTQIDQDTSLSEARATSVEPRESDEQEKNESDPTGSAEQEEEKNNKSVRPVNPNLLTDVYQINISGQQPKKGIKVQIPLCKGMTPDDDIAIVRADEATLQEQSDVLSVLPGKPTIVGCNLIFEVSHFSIYVATWKKKVDTTENRVELQRQISSAREKRKAAALFAVVKREEDDPTGLKHVLIVECVMGSKSTDRRQRWLERGFQEQNPPEKNDIMMVSGETFYANVTGNATLEDEADAKERKIQFSQCRSSFQPYKVKLNEGIYNQDEAYGHVVISKKTDSGLEDIATLRIKLTAPPRPPSPPSPSASAVPTAINNFIHKTPEQVYKPKGSVVRTLDKLFKKTPKKK